MALKRKKVVNVIQGEPKRVRVVGGDPSDLVFRREGPNKTRFEKGEIPVRRPKKSFVLRKGFKDKALKVSSKKKKDSLFMAL